MRILLLLSDSSIVQAVKNHFGKKYDVQQLDRVPDDVECDVLLIDSINLKKNCNSIISLKYVGGKQNFYCVWLKGKFSLNEFDSDPFVDHVVNTPCEKSKILYCIEFALQTIAFNNSDNANVCAMSMIARLKDEDTGDHILRTQQYVKTIAIGLNELDIACFDESKIHALALAAPLHDIGKIGIPDAILKKPGKLTDDEYTTMKKHSLIGYETLSEIDKRHGTSKIFSLAAEIALNHHEKWNGKGYPNELSGEQIPLSGRIMAVADVFDAISQKRVYKEGESFENSFSIVEKHSGLDFDPNVVKAFKHKQAHIEKIYFTYQNC